jgi:hypothetical protein
VHARRLPRMRDLGFDSEHDLAFFVRPIRLVIVLSSKFHFQHPQLPRILLMLNGSLNDDSVHSILDVKDDSRILSQVPSLRRMRIGFEVEILILPDSPNWSRVRPAIDARGRYPIDFLGHELVVSVFPTNPLLRIVRDMPFGRQFRSNSTRHKLFRSNEDYWSLRLQRSKSGRDAS